MGCSLFLGRSLGILDVVFFRKPTCLKESTHVGQAHPQPWKASTKFGSPNSLCFCFPWSCVTSVANCQSCSARREQKSKLKLIKGHPGLSAPPEARFRMKLCSLAYSE